jgi:TPP-dependent pyruvate/acetoin dehydrogenase alpha subunit
MKLQEQITVAKALLRLRLRMMVLNEEYKNGKFKIPIHLAFGHESIAVAVDSSMGADDQLVCSHRNLHYNLARESHFHLIRDEFLLRQEGIARGILGSMNLANPARKVMYSSSVLGNNMPVATGLALANSVMELDSVTIVVSGDGAMEEGSFYESLMFMRYQELKVIVIIENNGWSLATRTSERRADIDTKQLANSLGVDYLLLAGNNSIEYVKKLADVKDQVQSDSKPVVIEVELDSLGDWVMKNDQHPDGKYINYHAGPAPDVSLNEYPVIKESQSDPIYMLEQILGQKILKGISSDLFNSVLEEFRELH